MQYKVITITVRWSWSFDKSIEKLTAEVNEAIAQGWEPQGGLVVYGDDWLLQAMVKRR